jgi:hypothetical protein
MPLTDHHIQIFLDPPDDFRHLIYHHHIMPLPHEPTGDVIPDFSSTYDENPHGVCLPPVKHGIPQLSGYLVFLSLIAVRVKERN